MSSLTLASSEKPVMDDSLSRVFDCHDHDSQDLNSNLGPCISAMTVSSIERLTRTAVYIPLKNYSVSNQLAKDYKGRQLLEAEHSPGIINRDLQHLPKPASESIVLQVINIFHHVSIDTSINTSSNCVWFILIQYGQQISNVLHRSAPSQLSLY